ncbi:MAG TPA: MBL fold metallo-hydrolase, partial [Acidimicrobiales bacterium]|nr:MBL fold metallo-hydrolase [Acidimicrobiales bacterium]
MTDRWTVGDATITAVVESEVPGIPPELFFPDATAPAVAAHDWVVPTWAAEDGTIAFRVQAVVVEVGSRTVLVDPCVGDGRDRALPFWHQQAWGGYERLLDVIDASAVDTVVHTHLHADHVGWD